MDFVGTDDTDGARLTAKALLEAGHRDLAVVTTGEFPNPMYFRREGFEAEILLQRITEGDVHAPRQRVLTHPALYARGSVAALPKQ